ncbi:MAG: FAD:protein FMN transferase [Gammaproteobacteria bacterium]|nr:FAD:protein FMN transferase [Gammaproteobacteria bacterium]
MSALSQGAFDITVGALQGWRFRQNNPHLPSTADIRAQLPLVNYREWCGGPAWGRCCLNAGPTLRR